VRLEYRFGVPMLAAEGEAPAEFASRVEAATRELIATSRRSAA
jgi:hypothetical protein